MMVTGTARNAPNGPQIQAQKASASSTTRGDELALERGQAHECGRRYKCIGGRREAHEADRKQHDCHAGRSDVRDVVERHRQQPKQDRRGKSEQPCAERYHRAETEIDHGHDEYVRCKIMLHVAGNPNEAELGLTCGEE